MFYHHRKNCYRSFTTDLKDLSIFITETASSRRKNNWKDNSYDTDTVLNKSPNDYSSTKVVWEEPKSYNITNVKSPATRDTKSNIPSSSGGFGEAQKKFGAAKSISSAQYFGDNNNSVSIVMICGFNISVVYSCYMSNC